MTASGYIYDESQIEEQKAVVKILLNNDVWYMEWDEFMKAKDEGREKPVIYGDKLIFVDDETYLELEKLELWLKNNKN